MKNQTRILTFYIGLALFWGSFAAASVAAPTGDLKTLSESKQWLRLLHFKHSFPFGGLKSEVDPGPFFLSPDGHQDPFKELQASVDAFQNSKSVGRLHINPQCAFPARYKFLKEQLHWQNPDVKCPELETFIKKLGGDEISLIFSSAYPNSPPSMFGHTMLRVHSKDRADLLDFGISYAASAGPNENGLAFAVFGLMGGYFGQFAVVPYYMKVNEYNHAESRDLWEYDLDLSKEQIRTLLEHLWELDQNGSFHYFFIDENCSYRLLTILEVAKPEWDVSHFAIHVVPAETVKRLTETPGAVRAVHHRPSLHVQMIQRFNALNSEQRNQAVTLTRGTDDVSETVKSIHDAATIEAAIAYFQYKRLKGQNHLEDADQIRYTSLLVQRSSLSNSGVELSVEDTSQETRPDKGHAPYLLGVGGGTLGPSQTRSSFTELHFKFAYHDLLNSDLGYPRFSHVDFPSLTLRYSNPLNSIWIEKLGIMTVTSLAPMTDIEKQLSWKVDLSYISPKDFGCLTCHAAMFAGGPGVAKSFLSDGLLLYELALIQVQAGSSIVNGVRLLPTALTGALIHPLSDFKIQLTGAYVADVWQSVRQSHFYEFEWNNSLSLSQNWEMRAQIKGIVPGDRQNNVGYVEYGLNLNRYF